MSIKPQDFQLGHRRTNLSLLGLDTVERGSALTLVVTYVGPHSEGTPFLGGAKGSRPPQRPTVVPIVSTVPLQPSARATITAQMQNISFQMHRLVIYNGDPMSVARDWRVEDLRINGRSRFDQLFTGELVWYIDGSS